MKVQTVGDLKTPAFLVDLPVLRRNIAHMAARAERLGVKLRPHLKTHKTVEVARMQVPDPVGGVTVSTLAEAEFFKAGGFRDITYACPLDPNKIPEAARIGQGVRLNLLLDHPDTAAALESYGSAHNVRFAVFLKVDCGYHRAGVDPQKPESVTLGRQLHGAPHLDFRGILTHAGHSYHCSGVDEIKAVAREERDVMVAFAERLRAAGVSVPVVSIGSTPTAMHAESWEGVSEIRPGNYAFFDNFMATIGACTLADCAATILVSVVGHYPDRNRMLVDGGALAFSKDAGATHVDPETNFGPVVGHPGLKLASMSQELGIVTSSAPIGFDRFPIGSRLRVVPNHSCLAAALFPEYQAVEGNRVVDSWVPNRGW